LGVPVLGEVPKVEPIRGPFTSGVDGSLLEMMPYWVPISPFSDAIRIVHNSVFLTLKSSGATLLFSSALPGEGKTFVALSFAAASASESKRVIFIDADLRRSRIHDAFHVPADSPGFMELLSHSSLPLGETIRETTIPGFHYVPAGGPTANPVAVLKNSRLERLLTRFRAEYDVVVIDSPPLIGLADTALVAAHTDGVVLVARHGYTTSDAMVAALTCLESARARLIGSVLNMVPGGAEQYRRSRYFSSYYQSNRRRPAA
ncbi:MAG: CpsD/CapB family tyrosine-protein kinase, partial [Desulfomonile sp.]|nr:CpsD/CapB family tyrosine-protein kinase [Desulfomonile sp.]